VFVHNPLLDAGRQVGVDANGFQPGLIVAYNDRAGNLPPGACRWRVRHRQPRRQFPTHLLLATANGQAETSLKSFAGLTGNYRFYAWRQGQGKELDGSIAHQAGWGISADSASATR